MLSLGIVKQENALQIFKFGFIMHLKQFAMGDKTRGIVVPWLELLLYLYKLRTDTGTHHL